jgi:hypothetical protein
LRSAAKTAIEESGANMLYLVFDLLIQTLQFIQRILVLGAHDVYPTLAS